MKTKPKLPRAPLPKQVEKVHQKKSKDRKDKHKFNYIYPTWDEDK